MKIRSNSSNFKKTNFILVGLGFVLILAFIRLKTLSTVENNILDKSLDLKDVESGNVDIRLVDVGLEANHDFPVEELKEVEAVSVVSGHECNDELHFRSGESAKSNYVIALASFPGSGNTFTRLFLEHATRIHTGSVYNDKSLKQHFSGEGIQNSSVLFVKTHYPCGGCWQRHIPNSYKYLPVTTQQSGVIKNAKIAAVMYVLRNPFRTFLAEFQRKENLPRLNDHGKIINNSDESHVATVDWKTLLNNENDIDRLVFDFNEFFERWLNNAIFYLHEKQSSNRWIAKDGSIVQVFYFEDIMAADPESRHQLLSSMQTFLSSPAIKHKLILDQQLFDSTLISCGFSEFREADRFKRTKKLQGVYPLKLIDINSFCSKAATVWVERWGNCEEVANIEV